MSLVCCLVGLLALKDSLHFALHTSEVDTTFSSDEGCNKQAPFVISQLFR